MSFGGYGGPPPPPTFSAPPPAAPVNPLSTLSIVFGFVFAPVGAVLGHLALTQIKKRRERGRGRAVAGLTISYCVIVAAVVAVVVWAVLPGKSDAPATSGTSAAESDKSAKQLLLTGSELGELLGETFEPVPQDAVEGGIDDMAETSSSQAGAEPYDCIGPVVVAERSGYADADVRGFARQVWRGSDGVVRKVDEAVIELSTPEEAQAVFDEIKATWQRCDGQTVTYWGTEIPDAGHLTHKITDIRTEETTLAATVLFGRTKNAQTSPNARAVTVAGNYLVETEISFDDEESTAAANPETSGVDVAWAIADKIGA